jgi:hypothetical protein
MYDLGLMYAYHTQQFMSEEMYVKTLGRTEMVLRQEYGIMDDRVKVTPFDLDMMFDVDITDGSIEGGEYAEQWVQYLQVLSQFPGALQVMDVPRMLLHVARIMKAKDAHEFLQKAGPIQSETRSNEEIEKGVAQGNIARIEDAVSAQG